MVFTVPYLKSMFSILRKKNVKQINNLMKTKEFEKAIDALNLGIVIDEMKLNHSNVRQVTGHLENEGVIWNEKGEGFSTEFEMREKDGELVGVFGSSQERNKMYDLKFE